ncbi:hypothetical protein TSUD_236750 [Trifolium subterraneum]|uniref:Survival Motor Neuron Gemin2-binding domain-containing protein n=1 Tax=Trifolium subterraneum TaxID=3900 RepID=A0A2Z6NBB6_TRISU|nr:hypothetical protein TSUD_236750 [Trifolium subterraneum]
MGKDGDLWDDSALINAFDDAISSYKKMHITSKNKQQSEEIIEQNAEISNTTRVVEEKIDVPTIDSSETSNVSKLEENQQLCLDSTNGKEIQSEHNDYSNGQGLDDYNQLVAQYYELEEKRLKILDQINQYGGWNYQYAATESNSGVPCSDGQDYSMSVHQVPDPNVVCTCCPCFSQCALASCTSVPGCSIGGSCAGKPNDSAGKDDKMLIPCEDGKIREMAMGAAERALSTIRTTISGDPNVNEDKERKNSEPEKIGDSETDLTAVLNAWYSAGFHTGNGGKRVPIHIVESQGNVGIPINLESHIVILPWTMGQLNTIAMPVDVVGDDNCCWQQRQ